MKLNILVTKSSSGSVKESRYFSLASSISNMLVGGFNGSQTPYSMASTYHMTSVSPSFSVFGVKSLTIRFLGIVVNFTSPNANLNKTPIKINGKLKVTLNGSVMYPTKSILNKECSSSPPQ